VQSVQTFGRKVRCSTRCLTSRLHGSASYSVRAAALATAQVTKHVIAEKCGSRGVCEAWEGRPAAERCGTLLQSLQIVDDSVIDTGLCLYALSR
jgi:hypothetical protein